MVDYQFSPFSSAEALLCCAWRYGPGYGLYDMSEHDAVALLAPSLDYRAVRQGGRLVGIACFGAEARVKGGPYDQAALDLGCQLDPALCGQGLGKDFVAAVLRFAIGEFRPPRLRLTVACDNLRAIKTYERSGFAAVRRFAGMSRGGTHRFFLMSRAVERM